MLKNTRIYIWYINIYTPCVDVKFPSCTCKQKQMPSSTQHRSIRSKLSNVSPPNLLKIVLQRHCNRSLIERILCFCFLVYVWFGVVYLYVCHIYIFIYLYIGHIHIYIGDKIWCREKHKRYHIASFGDWTSKVVLCENHVRNIYICLPIRFYLQPIYPPKKK